MYAFIADIHLFTNISYEDQLKSLEMFLDIIRKQEFRQQFLKLK